MALRLRYDKPTNTRKIFEEIREPIARAATAAVREAGETAKREGRANIAAAGFSSKWQNALRANHYPEQGTSVEPAALIFHKIPYAGVFEQGAQIAGKPTLYLPLSNAPLPAARGGRKMTPSLYVQQVGPLAPIKRPGKPPLLAGRGRGTKGKVVPLFFGIDSVSISKKFRIAEIVRRAAGQLGALYVKHFRV